MAKRRKSEKLVEIHEFYVIRSASGSQPAVCAECSTVEAIMVGPEHAAAVAEVPLRIIYRWVELGALHYKEGPDGSLTICLKSLVAIRDQVRGF